MQSPGRPASPPPDLEPPRWIRAIDWVIVGLVLVAGAVFLFGGFRTYVGPVRIAMTSWGRVAIAALVLTAIRHLFVRTPTLPRVIGNTAGQFWRSEERRTIWPPFIATRFGVLLVGYLAVLTIGFAPRTARFRVSDDVLENLPARWDVQWYLGIARDGYAWNGDPSLQQNVVFFPAFPMAMRFTGLFFGRRLVLAGQVLSLAAFFGALLYLYRLARDLLDDERACRTVWLLAAYPFAVYFSAPYTESLYLVGALGAFYHLRHAHWGRAAAWGVFVSLCRPNGFFIALPIATFVLDRSIRNRRLAAAALLPVLGPILGVLGYSLFLYIRFDDGLAWVKGQAAWGRNYVGIWPSVEALYLDRYHHIANEGLSHYAATKPYDLMYTVTALFVLVSIWPTTRRFGAAYGLFTAINILPPLIVGGMMSIGRMSSVLFPAFLWLGAALPKQYVPACVAAFCVLQGLVAVLFFTWRPVF